MFRFITSLCDFLIPRECPSCGRKLLPDEIIICPPCFSSIKPATITRLNFEYKRKLSKEGIISGIFAPFVFEKDKALQHLIHSVKYERRFQNGFYLGRLTGESGRSVFQQWNIEIIVPVPLHRLRKAERGYNQSEYIAKGISKSTSIPVERNSIKRKRFTATQTKMNIVERKQNIHDAFEVKNSRSIEGKTILLVDDVMTTGSTMAECGKVLLENGAVKVYAASAGIAG